MNVFLIPSWYPAPRWHLAGGSFLEEFAHAIARHRPEINVDVSLWGQGSRECSSARLRAWLAHPVADGPPRPARRDLRANLSEWSSPTWTWRHGWRRGNAGAVLRACRAQLARVREARGRVDLLHAHVSFPAGWIAMQLAAENGLPWILTEHMGPFPFAHLLRDGRPVPEVAEPVRTATRVVAVSRALATAIRERTGREAEVVPNAVDEAFFTPATAPARGEGFTFLTVASLQPEKGIGELLAAIAALPPAPGVRFRIAGGGAQAKEYRAQAAALGVAERVAWLGPLSREAVRDEMRACDAFVLPSRHESFGVVYAEALACGRPVIATRCGGPEDIVDETNGVLVEVGDAPALAAALGALAARERTFDAAQIRAGFERRFASAAVAARYAALYADVAGVR